MWIMSFWKWLSEGIWKSLQKDAKESIDFCTHSLMGDSGGS
jgi:hypothetical protein